MFGWIALGIVAVGGAAIAYAKKHGISFSLSETSAKNKTLAEIARNQDSVFVPVLAVQPGFASDTINAELAAIKVANTGKETLRVDDIIIDGPGTARGIILGTPFAPTTVVRIQLKDIKRIERPNPKSPEGFDTFASDLVV